MVDHGVEWGILNAAIKFYGSLTLSLPSFPSTFSLFASSGLITRATLSIRAFMELLTSMAHCRHRCCVSPFGYSSFNNVLTIFAYPGSLLDVSMLLARVVTAVDGIIYSSLVGEKVEGSRDGN
jgi:hypothetical protein